MSPQVSIIIAVYNGSTYIDETLRSVSAQTYLDWECIVIDDGSTDSTALIAKDYSGRDGRFRYFYQENKGLSAARNTGILNAKGRYIHLLDADDLISTSKLEIHVGWMLKHPASDISYSDARYFKDLNPEVLFKRLKSTIDDTLVLVNEDWIERFDNPGHVILSKLLMQNLAPVSSFMFKHSVVEKVGLFDESFNSLEDWEYWARCAVADLRFSYIDNARAMTFIRVHTSSMTHNRYRMAKNYIILIAKHWEFIKSNNLLRNQINSIIKRSTVINFSNVKFFLLLGRYFGIIYALKTYISALNRLRKKQY